VIATGGIGDGRGIAAAFALGASGVQLGSAFLRCPEAGTGAATRARLAVAEDGETMVTDAVSGRSARAVASAYARDMADLAGRLPPYLAMYELSTPIESASAGRADEPVSFHLYGQAAGLGREEPAGEVMARLVTQAQAVLGRLAGE
jgi:nitronate monooxygenase